MNITDKTVIESINRKLHRDFRVLDGRPIYRLVWSADQFEVRVGTFTDWYGHILIREEHKATRTVNKYWFFPKPCWVLEKLIFIRGNQALKEISEELVESKNGIYEAIYPFRDADDNPLPVWEKVVFFILDRLHNPRKILASDLEAQRLAEELAETKYFEEKIGEGERPELFVWDNSAFVSTRQMEFKKSLEYKVKDSQITPGA